MHYCPRRSVPSALRHTTLGIFSLVLLVHGVLSAGEGGRPNKPRVPKETGPRPGLIGWYYEGNDFDEKKLLAERIDPKVEFIWGADGPAPGVPEDGFGVRWVGSLIVKDAGHYTFAVVSDDGARLSVDGKQIINQWVDQSDTRAAGEIDLTAGEHAIQLEYYENGGGASCKLYWARNGGFDETIIPTAVLQCDPKVLKNPPARPGTAPDLADQHPEFPDGFNPAEWTVEKSNDPKGREHMAMGWQKSARREDRGTVGPRYTLKTAVSRHHILRRPAAADGTNEKPLITTVGLQQTDQHATPFRLAYCWDARNFVAVGMYGRYQSAVWVVQDGRRSTDLGMPGVYLLDSYYRPAYYRLVLLTDTILVQASSQRYFNFRTIQVIRNRKNGMTGKPATVMGFGTIPWEKDYGQPNLCNDWPNNDMTEEATEILYFDQRSGMNIRPGRLPEIGESTDWDEAETQLHIKAQPTLWNVAILGKDYRNYLATQEIESEPQLTKEASDKRALTFASIDLKDNSEPFDFAFNPLFKTRDMRKTAALVETTIPRGEDPFVRIMFGVLQQGSIKSGGAEVAGTLAPGYYQTHANRYAVVGRVEPANSGVLRFKLWNDDRELRMWAQVLPNFPGSRIAQLQALMKKFPQPSDRARRVMARLEMGALGLQFYDYALAREQFEAALVEALAGVRQDQIEQALLSLMELYEITSDSAGLEAVATSALKSSQNGEIRLRAWICLAEARQFRSGPAAAGAWLNQSAETLKEPLLKRDLFRLAARGYAQAGQWGPAAVELDKAAKALADENTAEIALTAMHYRIDEAIAGGMTADQAVIAQIPLLRQLLDAQIAASPQQPRQSIWSKYWVDRAAELEPKQPGRCYAALQAALYEQMLWRLAPENLRAELFAGQPLDYTALVDIAKDKFPADRNKLWEVSQPEMSPKWELHAAEPLALDPLTHVYEGEKGGGTWSPVKEEWYHLLNIEREAPVGAYHARATLQIPANPPPDLKIWLGLNGPGKIWIDGKLVFTQTRATKSLYDMASLPAADFKPGPHQVLVKLIHNRRDLRSRASVRVSTMSVLRVYLQYYEASAILPNYREYWTLQDRLAELSANWGEFLSYDGLALASFARAKLAVGSQDYAIDRAIGSADAAMRAPDPIWAQRIIEDVAWRLALSPRADHRTDSIYALLERWRNLGLDQYNLAILEEARRFGLAHDTHGRGGAFGLALQAETQGLLGNLETLQEAIRSLQTEYADCDNALVSAGALVSRLGRRERAQRDFLTSDEATADIEDAQRMIEQEEYKRALARLLKAAAQSGEKLYRVEGGRSSPDGRLVSVRAYVRELLSRMPAALWPIYAENYDARSLAAFDAAAQAGGLDGCLTVADEYPFTAGSLRALNLAAALAVDAGRPENAGIYYERLLEEHRMRAKNNLAGLPGGQTDWQIRYKRADALWQAGRNGGDDLKSAPPDATATLICRGQPTPLLKLWNDLAAKFATHAAGAGAAANANAAPPWRSLRGNLEQTGRIEADLPLAAPVLAWEGQASWVSDADSVAANLVPAPYFAGLQTAAIEGDSVVSAGDAGFIVRKLSDGRRLWSQTWDDELLHLEDQGRVIDFTGVPMHAPDLERGTVAARVIDAGHAGFEARRLADGCLIASTRTIDELKNFHAFGAPMLADGLLIGRFLSIRDSGALALAAVDLSTGRLRWLRQLVTGTAALGFNDVSIPLAIQLPPPAARDGVLYFDTGLGAIAAVEARTGTPRWVTHYDRAKVVALDDRALQRAQRYMMSPYAGSPCLSGNLVLVRPRDRAIMLALDAASGRVRWQRPSDQGWYLIGATPTGIYTYDGMLKFIDAATGEAVWSADLPIQELTGRGFLARDGIVLPTTAGLALFSPTDGRRIRTLKLPPLQTRGHLSPVVQNGKLVRLMQADERSLRCWTFNGDAGTPSLESQLVGSWDNLCDAASEGDDNPESEIGSPTQPPRPAGASAAVWWQQLIDHAKNAPQTPGEFLYKDPNDGLVHLGSEWAVDPALLQPFNSAPAAFSIPDFNPPLPPATPTAALVPLMRFDGGQAEALRDPNDPGRVYVYAGGILTALDLSRPTPAVLWRRVTTGNLTAIAANEGRVAVCSYNRIAVYDAGTGMPLLTRRLGIAGNWNQRPEWITNVAVGRHQVAVFLSAEVGFRQWYDQNSRSKSVEVYDLANGAALWRRSLAGYYNHFEGPAFVGDKLFAYETPEHHSETSFTWTFAAATGEALKRDTLSKGRDYTIFNDPANRGYFLHHSGELAWFDVQQGDFGWKVTTPLLEDDYTRPFGVTDSSVVLMGRNDKSPYTVNVLDRKTGKTTATWQGDGGIVPEGGSEYYTFSGIAHTYDLKLARHNLADPAKTVFEQVWPGLSYLRLTPFSYVTGDSVVLLACARQYYVQPWYEYVVFSRSSGMILHHDKFSLEPRNDRWGRPAAQAIRFGRNFLLMGKNGVMVVGPLTSGPDAAPVDLTSMKTVILQESARDPLRTNLFRSALSSELPPCSMALRFGGKPPIVDGNLGEWQGFDPWELKPPLNWHSLTRQPLTHPELHDATLRSAWDREGLYLAIEVRDPSRQPAPPNADCRLGDSIRVTILGEDHLPPDQWRPGFVRDNTAWVDLAFTGTGSEARLARLTGDENRNVQFSAVARPDLGAGGRSLELFIPWTALDLNLNEWREDRMVRLLLNVAIADADEGRPAQGMLEFGAGVSSGFVEPHRFGEIHLIDLSSERMAQMLEVIDIIPDDPKTWEILSLVESSMRGAAGMRRRIDMYESFVRKHPASPVALRAIPHLGYLYAQAGLTDGAAKALRFAADAKVPGDKLAPYMKSGFHFKLWLNPQNPPSQVMVQFHTNNLGWARRGSWGNLYINWGQRDTPENMLLGPLPETGKWLDMFIPSASQGLEGETIIGVAFTTRGGDARFDSSQFIDANGLSLVYLDDSDEGFNFTNTPIGWDTANKASGNQSFFGQTKEFISNLSVEPKNRNARNFKFPFVNAAAADPTPEQVNAWFQAAHLLGDHPMGWEFFNRVVSYINEKKNKVGLLDAYLRYVKENPDSPYAAKALKRVHELGKNQFAVDSDLTKVEAFMKEATVTTAVRRAFYAEMCDGLSALDIVGPLDGGPTAGAEVQYDPEKNLDFKARLKGHAHDPDPANPDAEPPQRELTWTALDLRNSKEGRRAPDNFNFRTIWPEKKDDQYFNRVGFAHFTVTSKNAMPAYLYVGAERVITVYVNNKQIVKNLSSRGQKDHSVIPIRLVAGENHVLIKFGNGERNLSLQVRVADRNGRPIDGLKFGTSLTPPPPPPPDPKAK